ncbi:MULTISPECIES: FadR/GntR family transcriptional regulator [Flammeovirga]|uniref:FadR family transcriptional regulator n=1 Tax=Flammeovirga agarivorans TaxID=2726742 RepID=A0A7X8SQ33_9BACT|nr:MULTISPECIES: FadR/GntR family transcriptional regulator [Flammeovirga]NLR94316.1 FadR family transcriptional regulator [Flammeovirga agarivorans]
MEQTVFNTFRKIEIEKPVDKIIKQVKALISTGQLKAGDKLPSERKLSDLFGIGRTHVRDAIRKLEFYGILKTLPQSGTVVAGFGITALEGLITDVLDLEGNDFTALVETRVVLERNTARFAALRRDEKDIVSISSALSAYEEALKHGRDTVEHDLMFHMKIAEASKNTVLKSLMLIVAPDIITFFKENDVCSGDKPNKAVEDHYEILEHISNRNPEKAEQAMYNHLRGILKTDIF